MSTRAWPRRHGAVVKGQFFDENLRSLSNSWSKQQPSLAYHGHLPSACMVDYSMGHLTSGFPRNKPAQCSGSVQRRISAQNSGSPTAQHSKLFKHWQRMCAEFQETFHGTLHDKRETFQNNVKHIKKIRKHSKYYLFHLHKFTKILWNFGRFYVLLLKPWSVFVVNTWNVEIWLETWLIWKYD